MSKEKKLSSSARCGAEQKQPINIKSSDQIICTYPIHMGPGWKVKHCMKPMEIMRYKHLFSVKKYHCSNCMTMIDPGSQFVAVCREQRLHVMQCYNVICCSCIENESQRDLKFSKSGNMQSPAWFIQSHYWKRRKY